ncbi:MAG: TIGR02680 family protein, partial [Faecousia sp.]
EFKKKDLDVYLTIGIGLRAQKGKGMDFWGFCLNDGRRIGYDFELYEKLGDQMLSLSKQKLKNIIADQDNWAENPGAYKKLVNDRLYQFQDIRQFDQMVQLLIKVRAPKLSKDFRPTMVKEILTDSLQVLSDDDLSSMVSTMERMDELTDTLQGYNDALKSASIIRNEYNRYNQFVLGRKGKAYSDASEKTQRQRNALQDQQGRLDQLSSELQRQDQRRIDAHSMLVQAQGQRDALGDGDLIQQQRKLEDERENEKRQKSLLDTGIQQQKDLEDTINQKECKLRELKQTLREHEQEIRSNLHQLDAVNQILLMGDEHQTFMKSPENDQVLRAALSTRKKMLGQGLDAIRKLLQAQDKYDQAAQALDQANAQQAKADAVVQNAQVQEQEERDRIIENFARWQQSSMELSLSEQDTLLIRQALARYRAPSDWTVIQNLLNERHQARFLALNSEKQQLDGLLERLGADTREKQKKLDEVRRRPDPIPPRREQTDALRIQLVMSGIPHAAFYETVDFPSDLPARVRDRLEAQLLDAGLLDALIVPTEYHQQLQEFLEAYPDRFLIPGAPVVDPITSLVPDPASPLSALAAACLSCISQSDMNATTAVLPDGRFRNGIVQGRAHGYDPAGFIGAAARRANRERQIAQLQQQLHQLEEQIRQTQQQKDILILRLEKLQLEWTQLPNTADLDCAIETLADAQRLYDLAAKETQRHRELEQQAKRNLGILDNQCRDCCRSLPYQRTEAAYTEAQDAVEEYGNQLNQISKSHAQLQASQQRYDDIEADITTEYDRSSKQKKVNSESELALKKIQAVIDEIEAFLARPENVDRARRIQELNDVIQSQDQQERDAEKQYAALTEKIDAVEKDIQQQKNQLTTCVVTEMALVTYFKEDLQLGLVEKVMVNDKMELPELARQASSLIQAADRERTLEQIGEVLRNNFQSHNNELLKYHPKLELVFDPPEKEGMLRQRFTITLQKDGREMSLYQFIASLQEDIALTEAVLEDNDKKLFEDILLETISHKLRRRINESQKWCEDMTALMRTLNTSMGLHFSLDWKPQKAETPEEMDTAKLVSLLNKDRMLLTKQDSEMVSGHFRAKVRSARQAAIEQGIPANYADLIRTVLDYRTWYEFHLYYQRDGEGKKELTNSAFSKFSGGEKAMAMYVPLFASVSAQYKKASETCPKLLALDEAFAGVDDRNIGAMFELVGTLDFDYIMNSQALWGCYSSVRKLNIVELHRPGNASFVTLLRYFWDGSVRVLQEDGND